MNGVEGFMYPNEVEFAWSVLIVLYPYITGLVAGAFILASLERVFHVEAVKPTYRLALLTALSFLLVAPLPLQLHLGHPERSPEMYFTPHSTSAMAMFGYVYLWYLMAVLVFEIWLDYRRDIVLLSQKTKGLTRWIYKIMTMGSSNISERSLHIDERVGWVVTLVGIPSAFMLHGYVGFIFGSIKANPWWSSPLMPVVFIFSAMVSGIAGVMVLYSLLREAQGKSDRRAAQKAGDENRSRGMRIISSPSRERNSHPPRDLIEANCFGSSFFWTVPLQLVRSKPSIRRGYLRPF